MGLYGMLAATTYLCPPELNLSKQIIAF
jgi:hypothetical protein